MLVPNKLLGIEMPDADVEYKHAAAAQIAHVLDRGSAGIVSSYLVDESRIKAERDYLFGKLAMSATLGKTIKDKLEFAHWAGTTHVCLCTHGYHLSVYMIGDYGTIAAISNANVSFIKLSPDRVRENPENYNIEQLVKHDRFGSSGMSFIEMSACADWYDQWGNLWIGVRRPDFCGDCYKKLKMRRCILATKWQKKR